jgi:hypothetical protein
MRCAGLFDRLRKPALVFIMMLAFGRAVYADPQWYPDPSLLYPRERYITAIGIGDKENDAKAFAISGIAQYFHSSVKAEEDLIIQYNTAVSSSSVSKVRSESVRKEQMKSSVNISSVAEFRGIHFTVPSRLASGEWVVLGFIDKAESLRMWKIRADNNRALIDSLVEAGDRQQDPLYRHGYMKQAASIAGLLIADIAACSEIGPLDDFAETLAFARRTIEDYNTMRSHLTFEIRIDGDRNGALKNRLSALLNGNGYTVVPRNALYSIAGEVSAFELTMEAGLFVRIGAELRIINGAGTVLHSFVVPQDRLGAYNWDAAYSRAFGYLGEYLENNLISEITAFIDG